MRTEPCCKFAAVVRPALIVMIPLLGLASNYTDWQTKMRIITPRNTQYWFESVGEEVRRGTTERFYLVARGSRWLDDDVTGKLDPRQKRRTAVKF